MNAKVYPVGTDLYGSHDVVSRGVSPVRFKKLRASDFGLRAEDKYANVAVARGDVSEVVVVDHHHWMRGATTILPLSLFWEDNVSAVSWTGDDTAAPMDMPQNAEALVDVVDGYLRVHALAIVKPSLMKETAEESGL